MVKQTQSQARGIHGEQWFPAQLPEYWYFQKPDHDLGVDGVVVIAEQNQYNGISFNVQIKSSAQWKWRNGVILLGGVKRSTARDWLAGTVPTLIVFYDASAKSGHCAWALDSLPPVPSLLRGRSKTITVKARTPRSINDQCWDDIRDDLAAGIEFSIDALHAGCIANIVFPCLRDITRCLRILHVSAFEPEPEDINHQILLSLGQAVAHRDIILAVRRVLHELDPKCLVARQLQSTLDAYRLRVGEFYCGFDEALAHPDKTVVFHENRDVSKRTKPEMIMRATDFLIMLTSMGRSKIGEAQQGN